MEGEAVLMTVLFPLERQDCVTNWQLGRGIQWHSALWRYQQCLHIEEGFPVIEGLYSKR